MKAELLDLYPVNGKRPNLRRLVLEYLVDGQELTTLKGLQVFKTLDTRKVISDLRKAGIPIKDRWLFTPTGKKFKGYMLAE